ncbi:Methyltransferase domain-containing protein [Bosea lupini]|jgi:SAM-dependent methyltransferase|uniref:Methyltransferase domain-containing protein n=1 Tax=Bosea lupini TaxID=1036779 RepID=A0A1H7XIX5_9HYPH|nr:class I SAM-dependent methyltransferase [Bosea lupini]SEM33127.1 Methyltransferase domain-containing protein [Bosea lupini]
MAALTPDEFRSSIDLEKRKFHMKSYFESSFYRQYRSANMALRTLGRSPRVLSLGAGGAFVEEIVQKHLDASVFVVDFAETLAIESDLYGNFAGMFAGDISAPDWVSPLESVDAVFWFDNIEHLRIDPTRILRKLRSALSENGQIFITTDNFARLRNILKLIFNRSIVALPKDLFAEVDFEHEYVHRREYTRPELEACLREAGLKLAEVEMLWQSPSESLKKLPFRSFEYLFPRFRPHMLIRAQKAEQDVRLTTG